MADWLPDKWQVETAIGKDGSKSEYYSNMETGQTFHTKEALLHYANYLKKEEPDVPNFKKHFMNDDRTIFEDRPWEKDPKHTMLDYIQGRVGKCKGMVPESSSANATDAEEMREKLEQKIKGKAPASSSVPAKGRKRKAQKEEVE